MGWGKVVFYFVSFDEMDILFLFYYYYFFNFKVNILVVFALHFIYHGVSFRFACPSIAYYVYRSCRLYISEACFLFC